MHKTTFWIVAASVMAIGGLTALYIYFTPIIAERFAKLHVEQLMTAEPIEPKKWFYVRVFDCKIPIPNRYVLRSDAEDIFFYYEFGKDIAQAKYPFNITIKNVDDSTFYSSSGDFDIRYVEIKRNGNLVYEFITHDGKDGLYRISDGKQFILLVGGEQAFADTIFDYCVAHPVAENENCGLVNGMYGCSSR